MISKYRALYDVVELGDYVHVVDLMATSRGVFRSVTNAIEDIAKDYPNKTFILYGTDNVLSIFKEGQFSFIAREDERIYPPFELFNCMYADKSR